MVGQARACTLEDRHVRLEVQAEAGPRTVDRVEVAPGGRLLRSAAAEAWEPVLVVVAADDKAAEAAGGRLRSVAASDWSGRVPLAAVAQRVAPKQELVAFGGKLVAAAAVVVVPAMELPLVKPLALQGAAPGQRQASGPEAERTHC